MPLPGRAKLSAAPGGNREPAPHSRYGAGVGGRSLRDGLRSCQVPHELVLRSTETPVVSSRDHRPHSVNEGPPRLRARVREVTDTIPRAVVALTPKPHGIQEVRTWKDLHTAATQEGRMQIRSGLRVL